MRCCELCGEPATRVVTIGVKGAPLHSWDACDDHSAKLREHAESFGHRYQPAPGAKRVKQPVTVSRLAAPEVSA